MAWNAAARTVSDFLGEVVDYGLLGIQSLSQVRAEMDHLASKALDVKNAFSIVVTPSHWWRHVGLCTC